MSENALTERDRRFVAEIVGGESPPDAWVNAGFAATTAKKKSYEKLRQPKIVEAINAAKVKQQVRTDIHADYVLQTLRENVEMCMGRLESAHPVITYDKKGKPQVQQLKVFKHDASAANKALENLGRHLKLFTDQVEVKTHEEALRELEQRFESVTGTKPASAATTH
ncbi:MAG: hypothetical protein EVA65_15700 [Oceanococcus sp.]|nr:MAG: hypothetical protein EVA65_15700 [Oceanococcus sp.]